MFCNDPGIVQYNMNLCTGLKDKTPGAKLHPIALFPVPHPAFRRLQSVLLAKECWEGPGNEANSTLLWFISLFIHVRIVTMV